MPQQFKKDSSGQSLMDYLLGDASAQKWEAIMILACLTAAIMMFNRVKKRDVQSERTPTKLSAAWFIADNVSRILSTIFSIFIFSRLALIWISPKYVIAGAIVVGMISDQLPVIFGFIKQQAIVKIKTVVTKWFGGDKIEVTKTETTIISPATKTDKNENNTPTDN